MLQPSKNTKEIPISITITLQLKKLNKTCLPEAYATQKIGVISLKSGAVVIEESLQRLIYRISGGCDVIMTS